MSSAVYPARMTSAIPGPALVCTDGSARADDAALRAVALVAGRPVTALHVWEPIGQWGLGNPFGAYIEKLSGAVDELDAIAEAHSRELVDRLASRLTDSGVAATPLTVRSDQGVWQTILREAEHADAAVLVLGARGLSAAGELLLGSTSSAVLHHSKRPVLIVPTAD